MNRFWVIGDSKKVVELQKVRFWQKVCKNNLIKNKIKKPTGYFLIFFYDVLSDTTTFILHFTYPHPKEIFLTLPWGMYDTHISNECLPSTIFTMMEIFYLIHTKFSYPLLKIFHDPPPSLQVVLPQQCLVKPDTTHSIVVDRPGWNCLLESLAQRYYICFVFEKDWRDWWRPWTGDGCQNTSMCWQNTEALKIHEFLIV